MRPSKCQLPRLATLCVPLCTNLDSMVVHSADRRTKVASKKLRKRHRKQVDFDTKLAEAGALSHRHSFVCLSGTV